MNIISKLLLSGVASAMLASTAHAGTCNFAEKGSKVPVSLADIGLSGPSTTAEIATTLQRAVSYPDCTAAEIEAKLITINDWKQSATIPLSYHFSIPLAQAVAPPAPKPAEAVVSPAPQATASAAVVQPRPQSTPSVVRPRVIEKPVYTTKVVREGLSAADKQRLEILTAEDTRLQKEIDAINILPSPTADQLTQLAALTDQKEGIQAQMTTLSGRVNTLTNEVSGVWKWLYGIIALMVLGFGFLIWFKPSRKAVDTAIETELSMYVPTAVFEQRLDAVESRFKHVVEKTSSTLLPAQMKAMKDGNKFTYHLKVDGEVVNFDAVKVSTTPSGDAFIKVDVLASPVTAKQLFGALADYIENGGAMPTVKVVNA